jgi:hypothetical protein
MNTSCSMAILAVLVLLAPRPAAAAEEPLPPTQNITAVSPSPSPVAAGALETITISGVGKCGTFLFDLGDSTPTVHLPGNFPIRVYHAYSKPGSYRLKAQGQGDCTGAAAAHLNVVGPTITSMFLFSQVTPGGWVILEGQNFGNLPGKVLIHLTHYLGHPIDLPLQNLQWGDTFAAGTIPDDISGVLDQQATFTLVTQVGATSNAWTAQFTAAAGFAYIPFSRFECSTSIGAGPSDQCLNWGYDNWPPECGCCPNWGLGSVPPDYPGFTGYHGSGWGFHGNSGNDQFWVTAPLNNGWVFDSAGVGWEVKVGDVSQANLDSNTTSAPGTPSPTVGVDWYVGNCGAIPYEGYVSITGPVGVPF